MLQPSPGAGSGPRLSRSLSGRSTVETAGLTSKSDSLRGTSVGQLVVSIGLLWIIHYGNLWFILVDHGKRMVHDGELCNTCGSVMVGYDQQFLI